MNTIDNIMELADAYALLPAASGDEEMDRRQALRAAIAAAKGET